MIKRLHYPLEIILVRVRWYAVYPVHLRRLEEMMAERGVLVDRATVHRWVLKMLPVLVAVRCSPKNQNSAISGNSERLAVPGKA